MGDTDLASVSAGPGVSVSVVVDGAEVGVVPDVGVPVAVAVLDSAPALRSAWVSR